jgi:probable selenium-dependent hydroxylase accessory protein YqeC
MTLASSRVIALCGGGGKTSLMLALAAAFAAQGEKVLVTTTTRMAVDEMADLPASAEVVDASGVGALAGHSRTPVMAYHHVDAVSGKVIGYPPATIDQLSAMGVFDRVLVEADGSARRPLKAPASHEPVFPASVDAVVMVAGASGLGRPLDDQSVFRAGLWSRRTGVAIGDTVTPESLAAMVVHPQGLAQGAPQGVRRVLFVNQCDEVADLAAAMRVIASLRERVATPPHCAVLGRLKPDTQVLHRTCFEELAE